MSILLIEEEERRRKYHKDGRTDIEIASLCGITRTAITEWRINRSLKANKKKIKSKRIYNNEFTECPDHFYET
jgi:hypothetical protein